VLLNEMTKEAYKNNRFGLDLKQVLWPKIPNRRPRR
jgi:hypothetical protein